MCTFCLGNEEAKAGIFRFCFYKAGHNVLLFVFSFCNLIQTKNHLII